MPGTSNVQHERAPGDEPEPGPGVREAVEIAALQAKLLGLEQEITTQQPAPKGWDRIEAGHEDPDWINTDGPSNHDLAIRMVELANEKAELELDERRLALDEAKLAAERAGDAEALRVEALQAACRVVLAGDSAPMGRLQSVEDAFRLFHGLLTGTASDQ